MSRWSQIAIFVLLLGTVTFYGIMQRNSRKVEEFCKSLQIGQNIAQVRTLASQSGLAYELEQHGQLTMTPSGVTLSNSTCRAYFNEDDALLYRYFEKR